MIALYDFVPHYCANCGEETGLHRKRKDKFEIAPDVDYRAGASHTCLKCGVLYAHAEYADMMVAADTSKSDLRQYA